MMNATIDTDKYGDTCENNPTAMSHDVTRDDSESTCQEDSLFSRDITTGG